MRQAFRRADPGMRLLADYGFSKLAEQMRLRPNAISQWHQVPAHHVVRVEEITGIDRWRLRPDLYRGMEKVRA